LKLVFGYPTDGNLVRLAGCVSIAVEIKFKPASLTTLVDSPVSAGEYMRVVELAPNPPEEMDIVSDSPSALNVPMEVLNPYKSLVDQAQKLFGAQHFRDYHFLYTLSDHVAHFGLEHHESNDSRLVSAIWLIQSCASLVRDCCHMNMSTPGMANIAVL